MEATATKAAETRKINANVAAASDDERRGYNWSSRAPVTTVYSMIYVNEPPTVNEVVHGMPTIQSRRNEIRRVGGATENVFI